MRIGKSFSAIRFTAFLFVLLASVTLASATLLATRATSNAPIPVDSSASNSGTASPQNPGSTIVVLALPIINSPVIGEHQAQQNPNLPEYAHDSVTGQDLKWDQAKKSWVDQKTGAALGFDGRLAADGTVIPAMRFLNENTAGKYRPYQRPEDPEQALDPIDNVTFYRWDRARQTWKNEKTGEAVGFNGSTRYWTTPQPSSTGITISMAIPAAQQTVCPTQEDCDKLRAIYEVADRVALAAAQELIQATDEQASDSARANQLDQSAAHRGDPAVAGAADFDFSLANRSLQ